MVQLLRSRILTMVILGLQLQAKGLPSLEEIDKKNGSNNGE